MNIQFFAGEGKEKDNIKALRENRAEKVEELKLLYATLVAEEGLLRHICKVLTTYY